jgi:hypothetical protein
MQVRWVAVLAAIAVSLGARAQAEAPRPADAADLEGLWTNTTSTQLERPWAFGTLVATPAQAASWRRALVEIYRHAYDEVGGRSSEWIDGDAPVTQVRGQFRTSLITEPASGHLPYTAKGRELALVALHEDQIRLDGPEARPAAERCLEGAGGAAGAPMLPALDNANYRIVQTPDAVVISIENGAVRIIRLNGAAHLPPQMAAWGGDSIGRWEGATLVAETTNFKPGESLKSPRPVYISPAAKVTERFTRLSPGEILYEFAVDDPAVYSQVWRGEAVFRASPGREFEYACHEGNYSLPDVLAGARHEEAEAWRPNPSVRIASGD